MVDIEALVAARVKAAASIEQDRRRDAMVNIESIETDGDTDVIRILDSTRILTITPDAIVGFHDQACMDGQCKFCDGEGFLYKTLAYIQ